MDDEPQDGDRLTGAKPGRTQSPGFTLDLSTGLTPVEAWRRIVDVAGHGTIVPLTTGSGPAPARLQVGDQLVARTALGPLGFDDVMIVRDLAPGKRVVLEKVGSLIGGFVSASCEQAASEHRATFETQGCRVWWRQSVVFPFLPPPISRVVAMAAAPVLRSGYRIVLTRLLKS